MKIKTHKTEKQKINKIHTRGKKKIASREKNHIKEGRKEGEWHDR